MPEDVQLERLIKRLRGKIACIRGDHNYKCVRKGRDLYDAPSRVFDMYHCQRDGCHSHYPDFRDRVVEEDGEWGENVWGRKEWQ